MPTRGISFSGDAFYFTNLDQKEFGQKYSGDLQIIFLSATNFRLHCGLAAPRLLPGKELPATHPHLIMQ